MLDYPFNHGDRPGKEKSSEGYLLQEFPRLKKASSFALRIHLETAWILMPMLQWDFRPTKVGFTKSQAFGKSVRDDPRRKGESRSFPQQWS
jgi:hypothetical protein